MGNIGSIIGDARMFDYGLSEHPMPTGPYSAPNAAEQQGPGADPVHFPAEPVNNKPSFNHLGVSQN